MDICKNFIECLLGHGVSMVLSWWPWYFVYHGITWKNKSVFFHAEFDRRYVVQCSASYVCAVHGYCRLSSQCSFNNRSTPVDKFVLLSTKLALQSKHFSARNALKLTYRHLELQKFFRGCHLRTSFRRKRRRKGKETKEKGDEAGKSSYQIVSPGRLWIPSLLVITYEVLDTTCRSVLSNLNWRWRVRYPHWSSCKQSSASW